MPGLGQNCPTSKSFADKPFRLIGQSWVGVSDPNEFVRHPGINVLTLGRLVANNCTDIHRQSMTELEEDIMNYLLDHPEAKDTLDGIQRWWVLEQRVKREMAQVEKAVTRLIQREWLLVRRGVDSQVHYRLNPAKTAEIAAELGRKAD